MKVVLFCGGQGMRLREYSDEIPKPMVPIGYRPILWHLMKYYAYHGYKDFILCLGYKGDVIKKYFRSYDECLSNDFVMTAGGKSIQLYNSDIHDWSITFADTGATSNVGQRLLAVRKYLDGDEFFLANYADGLTDLRLPALIDYFHDQERLACFLSVKPNLSYHFVTADEDGIVFEVLEARKTNIRINGGFFVFNRRIFDYIRDGEELVNEPFQRLIDANQLAAFEYNGFWKNMDTFKDKQELDAMYSGGDAPWEIWKQAREAGWSPAICRRAP